MSDPIGPPVARSAVEAVELVGLAVSDGDLDAATAQYERGAKLTPWAELAAPAAPAASAGPAGPVRTGLAGVMALRLPVTVRVTGSVASGELALVLCERRVAGPGPDCEHIDLRGTGATVIRRQVGGGWRIVADAWQLASPGGSLPRDSP
jgi:ketosteroid isomerase-like protein